MDKVLSHPLSESGAPLINQQEWRGWVQVGASGVEVGTADSVRMKGSGDGDVVMAAAVVEV